MPHVQQFPTIDGSAYATEVVLPGSLATGLKALYLFDLGSLARCAINLAPGGVQNASFVGSPTINADGSMMLSSAGYLQTPIIETVELTIMMVVCSLAPLAGEASVLFATSGLDTSRTPQVTAGIVANDNTATTAPDGKITMSTLFGNTGDNPATTANLSAALDIPQWRTPSLLYAAAGTSSERGILGSQTLGTLQQTTLQTKPRFVNNVLPFRVGMNYGATPAGSVNMALWAYYNRILTSLERAAFQAWISTRLLRRHGYSV